jgi:hypothetical protein
MPTLQHRALQLARKQAWRFGLVIQHSPYGDWEDVERLRERSKAILALHHQQTAADVAALRDRYSTPILGEVTPYRLLELLAQVVDPTIPVLGCTSQLTHTLQVLELMERDGVPDDLLFTALFHDVGKLALLVGERPEHVEGNGRTPIGPHEPGIGLDHCVLTYGHGDIVHQRLGHLLPDHIAWLLRFHDISPRACQSYFDERDAEFFAVHYRQFHRYDMTYTAFRMPAYQLDRYRDLVGRYLPATVVF